jgi:alpha-tubulin suppressor-like RCC1 family protein
MKNTFAFFLSLFSFYATSQSVPWKQVEGGEHFSIGIKEDGTLWTWGMVTFQDPNSINSITETHSVPTQVGNDRNWAFVSVDSRLILAIKTNGTLWGWGSGATGQVDSKPSLTPVQIGTDSNWVTVASGDQYAHAIKSDGTLWSWGGNTNGELGVDIWDSYLLETFPVQVGSDSDWWKLGRGGCRALKKDSTLWAWGSSTGDGTYTLRFKPVLISAEQKWKEVASDVNYTLAIAADGSLWGWGDNTTGEIGFPQTVSGFTTPHLIDMDYSWKAVAAKYFHATCLREDGTLWECGSNSRTVAHTFPDYVFGLKRISPEAGWTQIADGTFHTLALRPDYLHYCGIGSNYENSIGIDSTVLYQTTFACSKEEIPLGLEKSDLGNTQTPFFPNPSQGILYFRSPVQVTMKNMEGTTVIQQSNCQRLELYHLPKGMYFVSTDGVRYAALVLQ